VVVERYILVCCVRFVLCDVTRSDGIHHHHILPPLPPLPSSPLLCRARNVKRSTTKFGGSRWDREMSLRREGEAAARTKNKTRHNKTAEGAADDDDDAVSDERRHKREGNPRFANRFDETLEIYQRIRDDQRGLRPNDVELASINNGTMP
jgi:hypothetical protein